MSCHVKVKQDLKAMLTEKLESRETGLLQLIQIKEFENINLEYLKMEIKLRKVKKNNNVEKILNLTEIRRAEN